MEISATPHYINLAFIPRDCDVAPKQKSPLAPQTKITKTKGPRTATDEEAQRRDRIQP